MTLRYHLATYGCQMNEYDSNMVAAMLDEHGYQETAEMAEADLILVNTCSVRGKAEDNIYQRIHLMRPLKDANPALRIAVIGCMAENHGAKITKTLKHVDVVAGPDQYRKLIELIAHPLQPVSLRKMPSPVYTGFDKAENYTDEFAKVASPFSTYVTIQRGCNKRCSYCIVPFTRGQEKYREPSHILAEIQHAVDKGVKEITLLGQTVNSYRYNEETFANLLTRVTEINGVERLRFMSPHPRHYSSALMDVLTHNPKICRHVHLPLQSGSNDVLQRMRRQYDVEDYLSIVEQLRAFDPLYGITTDVIVGFAGESDADFQQTLSVVKQAQFDSAFMFMYSAREGTEAFPWEDSCSDELKGARLQALIDLQHTITLARNKAMIGLTEPILVERSSSKNALELVGKTGNFKKVVIPAHPSIKSGDIVPVHIQDIRGWTLRGDLA